MRIARIASRYGTMLLLLAAAPAPATESLTLERAEALALERAPWLAHHRTNIEAAVAGIEYEGELPDPQLVESADVQLLPRRHQERPRDGRGRQRHRPDGAGRPGVPAVRGRRLATVLRPQEEGGVLHHRGQVEVISSLNRDGSPVFRDLRWGVYVVFAGGSDYAERCFKEYGLVTDPSGQYTAMYKPFHLIGLELGISVAAAALRGEPTGRC